MDLKEICKEIRCDIVRSIGSIGGGHLGGSLSAVELLAVLYFEAMHVDPQHPKLEGRDRFICSKGHAGPAVYAALANRGFFDRSELLTLNQSGTNLPSHCDMQKTPGIDMTAGSLGQGFSCAVGAALGGKLRRDSAVIYTLIGDGESQEGQIWEAAMFAAAKKLDNLIAFTDYNKLQLDGYVEDILGIAPLADKWRAFGWHVIDVADGNNLQQVRDALAQAKAQLGGGRPTMVLLNTVKGCGISFIRDAKTANHYMSLTPELTEAAIAEIRRS